MLKAFLSRLLTTSLAVGVLLLDLSKSTGSFPICQPGVEFWSTDKSTCVTCTKCAPQFTINPCLSNKDAICGPSSTLEVDWSFDGKNKTHVNQQINVGKSKMLWSFSDVENYPEPSKQQENNLKVENQTAEEEQKESDQEEEEIVAKKAILISDTFMDESVYSQWDWQTTALILAVCACIVFFLVAGCSALVYVRQWRRMKRNFEPAGLEEISARLNLMVKAELAELTSGAPINPGDPEMRCHYLEKLLDRKRETPVVAGWPETGGNLYIEEGETSSKNKRGQIARIHRNIESILTHKSLSSTSITNPG
ncbi:tumor necrosis factor receptor superfamily member wengen [Chelonus insularis]|uniref:tumor necrosis factor receptor superfamily member wengen n=1 Tax=Chelonus insularis TaxID=460826 RepID=UPI00158E6BFC|nr:tumor necrosis factor receptor superfamily member wengen [Chelonus insularis]